MEYWELVISTAVGGADTVAAWLTAAGFSDLVIEDEQEFADFLEENRACWDYIDEQLQNKLRGLSQIKIYLPREDTASLETLKSVLQQFREKNGESYGSLTLTVNTLCPTNWEEKWKENYPPQIIGNRLVVLPYWLAETEVDGRLPIILDPGLTFGTGAHPSTQMIMEFMEEMTLKGANCLDLGSGSGILSITALQLGAGSAIGVDIDPKAEDMARENAAHNGYGTPEFTALTGNVTADSTLMNRLSQSQYDLVLVNIVADVIISLTPVLPKLMGETTVLLLSGILDTRLPDVLSALKAQNLEVIARKEEEEWRSLKVRKCV